MNKVVILSGISGSGKSSYIRTLSERVWYPHFDCGDMDSYTLPAILVSADHYFMTHLGGKYEFDFTKLSLAHGSCFRYFIEAIQNKNTLVIVDNTNTDNSEISPYYLGSQAYSYDVSIVTFVCPSTMNEEEYIDRCSERNSHGVPEKGVRGQYKRLCNRQLPPWWNCNEVESQF